MSFTENHLIQILPNINNLRFLNSERGFQGQLVAELNQYLIKAQMFPNECIIEQEFQKTIKHHNITQRPDIIIHVPIESNLTTDRTKYNYYVIALKRNSSLAEAINDFMKLDEMFEKLHYQEGVFVNINAKRLLLSNYDGKYKNRINEISITWVDNIFTMTHSKFRNNRIVSSKFYY